MYSYGPRHMAGQKQDDQLKHTYSSYVRIRDVALKTCQRRWTIGRSGERRSGISEPVVRHNDDDDDGICTYMYLYIYRGLVGRVFANGLEDRGSIPGRVKPKTLKMVLDISLLNTPQYKVQGLFRRNRFLNSLKTST